MPRVPRPHDPTWWWWWITKPAAARPRPFIRSGFARGRSSSRSRALADINESVLLRSSATTSSSSCKARPRWALLQRHGRSERARRHRRDGVDGLGFRSSKTTLAHPNPVGLDGVYEALCPPYFPDMRPPWRRSSRSWPERCLRPDGPGPWRESRRVKGTVTPYRTSSWTAWPRWHGICTRSSGSSPGSEHQAGAVQAHHIDTDFYDAHYSEGAYLPSRRTENSNG